ncbi:hypothetical protein [Natrialba swarupiae]|uniref:Uncharacterized protein n=1 Tax=Natrialba swarupiae TaxID=2448032 RepID=A0A5D5AQD6_9EURY|nr:hypothetical protein [Natrialba swarupiae]TYT63836.1 hypothetical protein FYC77_01040 [Natrialba swarupiae]
MTTSLTRFGRSQIGVSWHRTMAASACRDGSDGSIVLPRSFTDGRAIIHIVAGDRLAASDYERRGGFFGETADVRLDAEERT